MNINDLKESIELTTDKTIRFAEIANCVKRAVQEVNLRCEKRIHLTNITGSGTGSIIISEDEEIISDDERTISEDVIVAGYEYDPDTMTITLPDHIYKVLDVYLDNEKMYAKTYEEVKASTDQLDFSINLSKMYLTFDLSGSTKTLHLRYKRNFPDYNGRDENYLGLPGYADAFLEIAVLYMVYSRPKYYNEAMMYSYRKKYEEALNDLNQKIMQEERVVTIPARYTY